MNFGCKLWGKTLPKQLAQCLLQNKVRYFNLIPFKLKNRKSYSSSTPGRDSKSVYSADSASDGRIHSVCEKWRETLLQHNVPEAEASVEYIVAFVLGKKTLHGVNKQDKLSAQQTEQVNSLCQQRLQHVPVQYIIGEWDFGDLVLEMRPPVFIPRPETEELTSLAASMLTKADLGSGQVLDVCTGSGAIILSLLHRFPQLQGVGVDLSPEACSLTLSNARRLGLDSRLSVLQGSLTHASVQDRLKAMGPFSLLVSNPPYIPTPKLSTLEAQILQHEDRAAFDGGQDGLDIVRPILKQAPLLVRPGGDILLEIDPKQPQIIQELVANEETSGVRFLRSLDDYIGKERFCHLQVIPY